jgi:hypothetical protein
MHNNEGGHFGQRVLAGPPSFGIWRQHFLGLCLGQKRRLEIFWKATGKIFPVRGIGYRFEEYLLCSRYFGFEP